MPDKQVYIIAEAGINHNGDQMRALEMIQVAAEAGADAVKFQTFRADQLVAHNAPKANYQLQNTEESESQQEMLKSVELSREDHLLYMDRSKECGIEFLSTPFDLVSVDLLVELGMTTMKIPSGEITNLPYLRKIGVLERSIILSTGMSNLGDIEAALQVLLDAGTAREQLTLLHCNTEYPTPMCDVNLKAMQTMAAAFPGIRIGYSDHTEGIEIPIAAVAMGAQVIEKHFTLDRTLPGPDHLASLEPRQLKDMVDSIRNIEVALGDGIKRASQSEKKNMPIARKSIVASRPIRAGERLSAENLAVKRPGTGISPMLWDDVVGGTASRDYELDELIET